MCPEHPEQKIKSEGIRIRVWETAQLRSEDSYTPDSGGHPTAPVIVNFLPTTHCLSARRAEIKPILFTFESYKYLTMLGPNQAPDTGAY